MKNLKPYFNISALSAALLLSGTAMVFNGCKNPIEDVNIAVNTESLSQSPTLVKFVKANPAGPEIPATMTVTISGPGKDLVQADNGGKTFTAANGLLPLTLSRKANPTATNPVVFTVSAEVAGYAPISTLISISSPNEVTKIELPMFAYAAPAKGTAVVQTEKPLTAGAVTTEVKIETVPTATTPQAATITIPTGTQMLDANKQPINAGSLKASVIYFGTTDKEGLKAASNLTVATNAIGPNNQQLNGETIFINAGAVSINITAGDKEVKHFSKPISVEVDLNPQLLNPLTGQLIKAGDVLPIWSRNEDTGQWTYEHNATVTAVGGKLKVVMNVNHLSDWGPVFTPVTFNPQPVITFISQIQFLTRPISLIYWPSEYSVWSGIYFNSALQLPSFSFPQHFRVGPYDGNPDDLTEEHEVTGNNQTITLQGSASDLIDTEISVIANCTNKKLVIKPDDTWLVLKDVTDNNSTTEHLVSEGKLNLKLKNGHEYSVTAIYDGKTYSSPNIKVDQNTNIDISNAALKVTGSYNAATKILGINGEFPLSNCK